MKKLEQEVKHSIWEFIFYSNFFMGLMSLALNIETTLKVNLGFNRLDYYFFIGSSTILFYLFAYNVPKKYNFSANPRTQFYIDFRQPIYWFKFVLWLVVFVSVISILYDSFRKIIALEWYHFLVLGSTFVLSSSYYNWKYGFSLRKYTWLKPVLIAWSWAITTVYLPVLFFELTDDVLFTTDARFYFHFIEIFMFFIVNAIMFDMKDFADDTNRGLKTFVVKYGMKFMLNQVILPLIALGFIVSLIIGYLFDFTLLQQFCLLLPLVLMTYFASVLDRSKPILFYLIAIDGIIAFKAVLGIFGEIMS